MKSIAFIFIKSLAIFIALNVIYSLGVFGYQETIHMDPKRILLISFILSTLLTLSHFLVAKSEGVEDDFSTNQKLVLDKEVGLTDLQTKIKSSTNWNLIEKKEHLLKFSSPMSLKSFGEVITIVSENGQTILNSKPTAYALFDYGKNYRNIMALKSLI